MTNLVTRLAVVREKIHQAARDAHREPSDIALIAVSKTRPAVDVQAAYAAGQRDFGENYLQDALPKIDACPDAVWHFIGPLQSNKTRVVTERFDWVHSVDRAKIAERLNDQRPQALPPLNVCVQVNLSGEASKSGCNADDLDELIAAIRGLPRLRLRGLMVIPARGAGPRAFEQLRALAQTHGLSDLSMGMTDDFETAIAAGATMVRIGTAVFGPRL